MMKSFASKILVRSEVFIRIGNELADLYEFIICFKLMLIAAIAIINALHLGRM